jgi:adenine specific DNA methylase Mod
MSLTILFQTPVDTGMAKIRLKVENANKKDFYLLAGKLTPVGLKLRRSVRGSGFYYAFLKLTRNNLKFICPSNSFKLSSDG